MKVFTIILFLFLSITAQSQINPETKDSLQITKNKPEIENPAQLIDSVLNYGKTLVGHRYRYGGAALSGFDCSGFIKFIFHKYGYTLPHCSRDYAQIGEEISKDSIQNVKKGDILLFKGRNSKSKRIGHVSIIVEANEKEILILHSCCNKGVAVESYTSSGYYPVRLVGIRRLKEL